MKLLATGNTAEVFEYEEDKVLKLYKSGYPLELVMLEYRNSVIMEKSPVHTPEVFGTIEKNGRHGIVFQRICGEDLYSEFLKSPNNPETVFRLLKDVADIQKRLSAFETSEGISYKDYLRHFGCDGLERLPDGNVLCHGDLHPGNIVRTPENELCLIDFMNVCHGPKEYDVARSFVLLTENNPASEETGEIFLKSAGMEYKAIEPFLEAVRFCRSKEKFG